MKDERSQFFIDKLPDFDPHENWRENKDILRSLDLVCSMMISGHKSTFYAVDSKFAWDVWNLKHKTISTMFETDPNPKSLIVHKKIRPGMFEKARPDVTPKTILCGYPKPTDYTVAESNSEKNMETRLKYQRELELILLE